MTKVKIKPVREEVKIASITCLACTRLKKHTKSETSECADCSNAKAKEVNKLRPRSCQKCKAYMGPSRYYHCKSCQPELPEEADIFSQIFPNERSKANE